MLFCAAKFGVYLFGGRAVCGMGHFWSAEIPKLSTLTAKVYPCSPAVTNPSDSLKPRLVVAAQSAVETLLIFVSYAEVFIPVIQRVVIDVIAAALAVTAPSKTQNFAVHVNCFTWVFFVSKHLSAGVKRSGIFRPVCVPFVLAQLFKPVRGNFGELTSRKRDKAVFCLRGHLENSLSMSEMTGVSAPDAPLYPRYFQKDSLSWVGV
jgi:hypothetical protein